MNRRPTVTRNIVCGVLICSEIAEQLGMSRQDRRNVEKAKAWAERMLAWIKTKPYIQKQRRRKKRLEAQA